MTNQSREIKIRVTINAAAEVVFKSLTHAEELEGWFPRAVESDPRPGGKFKFTFDDDEDPHKHHVREGAYREVIANRKLSYPWHVPEMNSTTEVQFALQENGPQTTVTLVHSGWPAVPEMDAAVKMHDEGWRFFLQNLKTVLEGGADQRSSIKA